MNNHFTAENRLALLEGFWSDRRALNEVLSRTGDDVDTQVAECRGLTDRLDRWKQLYREYLPVLPLSRCPLSGVAVDHSIDPFGLDGLWWDYASAVRPLESLPETYFALTGSVLPCREVESFPFLCRPGASAPYVVPGLLRRRGVQAVLSHIPVGKHHGFAVFYFSEPMPPNPARINSWGSDHYIVRGSDGEFYRGSADLDPVDADFDLEPWIRTGKLFWIAPHDESLELQSTTSDCPYLNVTRDPVFYSVCDGQVWSDHRPAAQGEAAQPAAIDQPARSCAKSTGMKSTNSVSAAAKSPPTAEAEPAEQEPPVLNPTLTWVGDATESNRFELIRPAHICEIASVLRRIRDQKLLADHEFKALHAVINVKGPGNTRWTVGLGSMRWSKLHDGKWIQADPPEWVWIDPAELQSLLDRCGTSPAPTLLYVTESEPAPCG